MPAPKNTFREALEEKRVQIGFWEAPADRGAYADADLSTWPTTRDISDERLSIRSMDLS